jgi:nitroimidazol reductase NimA-like FMN-containing flavoprotein (pyridoxamine 5'-phosphate oxidase superfamily)
MVMAGLPSRISAPERAVACHHDAMPDQLTPTDRTKVRRLADRGTYERAVIDAVIDEAYIAHVGFVVDGAPRVLPMTYGRDGDHLYLHGAVGNAMLRALTTSEVCVTITLLDGLVLARSAFHHSMNYRSVVLLGQPTKVEDEAAKKHAFDVIVEHVLPGRTAVARPTNDSELRTTLVLDLEIDEGSAKVRTGGPIDDEDDLALPVWAGVVPLRLVAGEPIQDPAQTVEGLAVPVAARP